jgi:predicted AlkP superfamily pyrophosphatase or phosphodiesterase
MKRFLRLGAVCGAALWALTALTARAADDEKPTRPIPAIERVLIISIDGLRPDRLLLAQTPVLHRLIGEGAYTMWAQTTAVSVTLPSHVSMLTGVIPRKHKIEWNFELPLAQPVYPAVPTVFELAKKWHYTTALITGKSKFSPLTKPGTIDFLSLPPRDVEVDEPIADAAVKVIREHQPDLAFVHFPAVDKRGHKFGWGSREQLAAIEAADACVGRVLAAYDDMGLREHTLVIVSADHGGGGTTHGAEDPRSRNIPWIASGPTVKKGFDLTQSFDLVVRTEDTCATACYVLGLGVFPYFDGKPVLSAFDQPPKP